MASYVPPQRSQVSPSGVTSRCQRMFRIFMVIGIAEGRTVADNEMSR